MYSQIKIIFLLRRFFWKNSEKMCHSETFLNRTEFKSQLKLRATFYSKCMFYELLFFMKLFYSYVICKMKLTIKWAQPELNNFK